jgi:hypothetical protein
MEPSPGDAGTGAIDHADAIGDDRRCDGWQYGGPVHAYGVGLVPVRQYADAGQPRKFQG